MRPEARSRRPPFRYPTLSPSAPVFTSSRTRGGASKPWFFYEPVSDSEGSSTPLQQNADYHEEAVTDNTADERRPDQRPIAPMKKRGDAFVRRAPAEPVFGPGATSRLGQKRKASEELTVENESPEEENEDLSDTMNDNLQSLNDPDKAWEAYEADRDAHARALAQLAAQEMTRDSGYAMSAFFNHQEKNQNASFIKKEAMEVDEHDSFLDNMEHDDSDDELPLGFIKQSIEEEIKPSIEALELADAAEDVAMADPSQLEEITPATYAPSGQQRDMRAMMDDLSNMGPARAARAQRSVAPVDFSGRRTSRQETPWVVSRYASGTVTRSGYSRKVRKLAPWSGKGIRFRYEAELMTAEKQKAEDGVEQDVDMDE